MAKSNLYIVMYWTFISFSCFVSLTSSKLLDLRADNWTLTNSNKSITVAGYVPGDVYTDLEAAGVISNPYYRYNDVAYRWIAYETWTYTAQVTVADAEVAHYSNLHLVLSNVNTISQIQLNEQDIGMTDNSFRTYRFNVTSLLKKSGNNSLSITLSPSVIYAYNQSQAHGYPVPPDCPPASQKGECYFNFVRTVASSYSWDWGPAFPTTGIGQTIQLEGHNVYQITDVSIMPKRVGDVWVMEVDMLVAVDDPRDYNTPVTVTLSVERLFTSTHTIAFASNTHRYTEEFPVPQGVGVQLWWPNGYGAPHVYRATVDIETHNDVYHNEKLVGFRTVELIQQPRPLMQGLTFYFKINGVAVYMKGSNFIPMHSFYSNVTSTYITELLQSAAEANFNMMRIWGGGTYELEAVYNEAAKHGIMIWQDMMFACALYPAHKHFIHNVDIEITQQMMRLKSHPSIIAWAANNENEAALSNDWFNVSSHYSRYYQDYMKLYNSTIYRIVSSLDTSRPFLLSSPTNGDESLQEGGVARDPYSVNYGDVHYYNYTCNGWDWQCYPAARFTSEYGRQSWCSLYTLHDVSDPTLDWYNHSDFAFHREHRTNGLSDMYHEITQHFDIPTSSGNHTKDFEDYIYLSQINQAVAIQRQTEYYRSLFHMIHPEGGYNMGALYWQLNDIWQAPTWSSLEYGGRWKMLHYYAKRFFSSNSFLVNIDDNVFSLYLTMDGSGDAQEVSTNHTKPIHHHINDLHVHIHKHFDAAGGPAANNDATMSQTTALYASISMYKFDNFTPLKTWNVPVYPIVGTEPLLTANITDLQTQARCDNKAACFLYVYPLPALHVADNYVLLTEPKDITALLPSRIRVSSTAQLDDHCARVVIQCEAIALYVWLETSERGRFTDNGFLMAENTKQLKFCAWQKLNLHLFNSTLAVRAYK